VQKPGADGGDRPQFQAREDEAGQSHEGPNRLKGQKQGQADGQPIDPPAGIAARPVLSGFHVDP
jgi:hypothetical protein